MNNNGQRRSTISEYLIFIELIYMFQKQLTLDIITQNSEGMPSR